MKCALSITEATMESNQKLFDIAIVITTILRPTLQKAVHSIFDQYHKGRIQILIGIDQASGNKGIIKELQNECPENIAITILDLGYSTSITHGGLYHNNCGGSLRTILTYTANSKYVTYLDDDNWYAPHHLSDLLNAVQGHDWAYTYRWFVNEITLEVICEDDFISVGPDKGRCKESSGGFVDANCLILDKKRCHMVIPHWCFGVLPDGSGDDRLIFKILRDNFKSNCTERPSVYYVLDTTIYPGGEEWLRNKGYTIT